MKEGRAISASEEMRALLDRMYASFATGDPTVWTSQVADDVIGIGTDPDEWWEGKALVAKVAAAQLKEMSNAGTRLTTGEPRIEEHDDIVWAVDRPILHPGDGGDVPMRVTVIAVSEAGTLRVKHFHYSVAATNEEVFRQELTTA
jgi:hypothetical protein